MMHDGFWKYTQMSLKMQFCKPDDMLRMYLDPDKTRNKFVKNPRKFKTYGKFVEYRNGNVVAQLNSGQLVEVPIYYTILDNPESVILHKEAQTKEDIWEKAQVAINDDIVGFEIEKQNS